MSRQRVIDVGVALVVFVLLLMLLAKGGVAGDEEARSLDGLGVLLAAGASLPLAARRRAPLGVFVATAAASALINGLHYPPGPPIGPMVALFFLGLSPPASRSGRRTTAVAVIALFAAHVVAAGIGRAEFPIVPASLGALVWGGAWVVGDRVRLRRERMAELEERARRTEAEAERERKLAAAQERTRIARDLHDSAGHAINVILVHAGAARLLAEKDPSRSREALGTIEAVARETLSEIDQLVRALREDGDVVEPPGLAALDTLVQRHRDAGLEVSVAVDGAHRPLKPAVDQAAYRILQESLTNALKHGAGEASIAVNYHGRTLELDVTNPSTTPAAALAGHGIVGMRERASLLGGNVFVESVNGEFRIRALLPYNGGDEA
jgi:signal transduction histidine kinase